MTIRSNILSLPLFVSCCGGMLLSSPHCHSPLLARGRISRGRIMTASSRPRNNIICSGVLFATNNCLLPTLNMTSEKTRRRRHYWMDDGHSGSWCFKFLIAIEGRDDPALLATSKVPHQTRHYYDLNKSPLACCANCLILPN